MYALDGEKQKIHVGVGKKGFRSDQWKDLNIKKELRTLVSIDTKSKRPRDQIAENLGMGSATYSKCKYVDKHGTEEQKKSLNAGKTSLDNTYKKISEEYALEAQDGRRNITKFKYNEKEIRRNDLKLRNEAKERQKRKPIGEKSVDLNSGRQNEDMTQRTDRKLAEKAGVGHDTIHKTRYVMEKADKELLDQMRSGETSLHAGYVRTKQKETGLDSLFKRDDYRVVYCDFYEPHRMLGWNPIKQYEALKSLPVKDHIEDYATCFLWSALPEVDSTLRVMKAWGFSYETMFILENDRKPEGRYNRGDHLVVVVGSGKFPCPPDTKDRLSSVIDSSIAGKQRIEKFRETIDAMYKTEEGPKLQIFNNKNSPDWDVINF